MLTCAVLTQLMSLCQPGSVAEYKAPHNIFAAQVDHESQMVRRLSRWEQDQRIALSATLILQLIHLIYQYC